MNGARAADDGLPVPLQLLQAEGYAVGKHFDAGHGLTGWIVSKDERSTIVYTTADRQVVIAGNLMDAKGQNVSAMLADQYMPKPDLKTAYQELARATYVRDRQSANPKRILYVVFDPNCPFCAESWHLLRQHVAVGAIEVRWVPVAYLQANSAGKVAAILGAKDPEAALASNEEGFKTETHQGGIAAAASVPDAVTKTLQANDLLMTKLGSSATPTFVWLDANNQVQTHVGLPSLAKMLEIVGAATPASAAAAKP